MTVRKTYTQFAGSATNNGQFGSAQGGSFLTSSDPLVIQDYASGASWAAGWLDAVIGGQKLPPLEEFQGVEYVHGYQIAYILEYGLPEYDSGTTYPAAAVVRQPGTYNLYGSVSGGNVGNALSNPTYWTLLQNLGTPATTVAVGTVADFAGSAAPALWLLCYGQAVSRTTYVNLFSALGTTYGSGDGSTTFNLPDCRGRTTFGLDNMGGTAANRLNAAATGGIAGDTLAATGGEQAHTMTTSELVSHTHTTDAANSGSAGSGTLRSDLTGSATTPFTSSSAGSSTPFNVVPPGIVFNKIIYAGV